MSEKQAHDNLLAGMDWLAEHHPAWHQAARFALRARMSKNIDTACVYLRESGVNMLINPDFIRDLSPAQVAGLLAHEVCHIEFNHLVRFEKEWLEDHGETHTRVNVASDAVINDLLVGEGFILPEGGINGLDLIGECCAAKSVEYVLSRMDDEYTGVCVTFGDIDGEGTCQDLGPAVEALVRAYQETLQEEGSKAGDEPGSVTGYAIAERDRTARPLAEQVAEAVVPDRMSMKRGRRRVGTRSDWTREHPLVPGIPRRKAAPWTGKGSLRKCECIVAVDTSGSVTKADLDNFRALLAELDTLLDVRGVSFDTRVVETSNNEIPILGGGTEFSCVTEWMDEQDISHKTPVVIITDGQASFSRGDSGRTKRILMVSPREHEHRTISP